ncbi:MAG TPA: nitrous oxide reductase accessory protein NosL [Flavipsychrobacter sp.]
MKKVLFIIFLPIVILLASCTKGYKPIDYGSDGCAHCKMTIMDARYGAELVTDKGKVYKFDDILCMRQYMTENDMDEQSVLLFVEKYSAAQNEITDAKEAVYIQHEFFSSPMNGNYAAFVNQEEAKTYADSLQVSVLDWSNIQ